MDPRFRGCYRWGGCFGIRLVAGLAQISYKSKNFFAEGRQPLLHHHRLPCRVRDRHRPVQPGGAGGGRGDGRQPVPVGCTPTPAFPLSRGNHVLLLLFQASLCGTVDPRFRGCDRLGGCFGIRLVAGLAQISYKSKNFFAEGRQPLRCQGPNPYGPRDGLCGRGAPRRESGGDVLFHGGRVAGASTLARGARVRVGGRSRGRAIRESPLRSGWGGVGGVRGGPLRVPSGQALREPQGERIWESPLRWAVGDAMGDGDAPRLRTCPGFPFSGRTDAGCFARKDWERACESALTTGVRSGGVRGGPLRGALRRALRELRANGFGRRVCGGEWGMRWGTETPRAAPLWIPAFAGMTRVGECGSAGAVVVEGPLRCALRTGFDRLRANGFGKRVVRWGVGDAMGDGGAPRRAPLDSCLRWNDARGGVGTVGSAGRRGLVVG